VEVRSLVHPDDRLAFDRDLNTDHPTIAGAPLGLELRLRKSNVRELLWVALHRAQFVPASAGRGGGRIYQAMDITSRRLAEQQLHHVAFHDSLTGLCNRSGFYGRVAAAVEVSRTAAEVQFAVVFIDLDRFKVVNDSLGHLAGNELLCEVGRRLTALLLPHDVIGRLGGDEFAILLYHPGDKEGCLQRAQDLLGALSPAATIRGHEVVVQASAGITFSDLGYRTVDELLRDADLAMYESKFSGRDRLSVYDRSMHERVRDKLDLEADLRHAIDEGHLSLAFQPLYVLGTNQLTGFEALARWLHPERGPVSPAVFIELAEECGLIENLTAWALDSALAQLAQWRRDFELDLHIGVNVNISGRDMARPQFVDMVLKALRRHAIAAQQLTLEITETVLMGQVDVSSNALALLHTAGVRLAIDDFGTGYSSLAYLSKLPIDDLKIDRSFVQAMEAGPEGVEIVRAVATLGHSLRKQVVAEGIETPAQLNALQALGIDKGQGYLLGRPMSPAEVGLLLTQLKSTAPKPGNLRYVPQSRAPAAKAELQAPTA
jgi:diguanylate cyclase (GGDEF)-like protein